MTTLDIIRRRDQVATATTAQLVATYNALTGETVQRFTNREAAERRTDMALMGALDAAAHRGLRPGQEPEVLTLQETSALGQDGAAAPAANEEGTVALDEESNPFKPGSLGHGLWVATRAMARDAAPRAKRAPKLRTDPTVPRRAHGMELKATFAGISKVQPGSKRARVLAFIQSCPEGRCRLLDVDAELGEPTRGFVQKLAEMKHLEVC